MTAAAYNQAGTAGAATSNPVTVPFPASDVQAGDIAVIIAGMVSSGNTSLTWNDGFTSMGTPIGITSSCAIAAAWKRCDGTEAGTSTTYSHGTGTLTRFGFMIIIRGAVASGTPFEGYATTSGNGTTATPASTVTTDIERLVVNAVVARNATANSGYTNFTQRNIYTNTSRKLFVADRTAATANTYAGDTITIGASAVDWASISFAILPAAGAAVVSITNFGDERHFNGETGLSVAGTGFGAAQTGAAAVIISPVDDVDDYNANVLSVSSWSATSIALNAIDLDEMAYDENWYLFVKEPGGVSNASGYPFQRAPRLHIQATLGDDDDIAVAGLSALNWFIRATDTGATIASGTGEATDGAGLLDITTDALAQGALAYGDDVWIEISNATSGFGIKQRISVDDPDYTLEYL